jgi:hypothetical protein
MEWLSIVPEQAPQGIGGSHAESALALAPSRSHSPEMQRDSFSAILLTEHYELDKAALPALKGSCFRVQTVRCDAHIATSSQRWAHVGTTPREQK